MIDYDPHRWSSHLFDIRGSMFKEIIGRVISCVIWSILVVVVHNRLQPHGISLAIPETAHSLVGVAMGLLLVFRTNASYDRFWEGRKQWGSIVNETRNMARNAVVCLKDAPDLARRCIAWTIVFPWVSMDRLRSIGNRKIEVDPKRGAIADPVKKIQAELERPRSYPGLTEEDLIPVTQAKHAAVAASIRMTAVLDEARRRGVISDYLFTHLDQNTQILIDCLGACERIHLTPMPYAYMVHLRRAVLVYCFTLPFAMLGKFNPFMVPVDTFVIAYVLLGIEEIGVEIEDPFGHDENDLPLESICEGIQRTLEPLMPEAAKSA
ncbi:MAG: bestrophin family protein [Planctomycetaceae bacterium]|nr:bestrophin family protein [Planctomycetaceae bacterium]